MKLRTIITVLIVVVAAAFGGWHVPINVNSVYYPAFDQTLPFGVAAGCTDGYDVGYDMTRPPLPPSAPMGYFYFNDPVYPGLDGLLADYRSDADDCIVWKIIYHTPTVMADSCWLKWDHDSLPPDGDFYILITDGDSSWKSLDWSTAENMRVISSTRRFWFLEKAYIRYGECVNIEDNTLPEEFRISAYPNPFNSAITISLIGSRCGTTYHTPQTTNQIEIFDINGRTVANIPVGVVRERPDGGGRFTNRHYETVWYPDESLGSGIYFLRYPESEEDEQLKLVYLK